MTKYTIQNGSNFTLYHDEYTVSTAVRIEVEESRERQTSAARGPARRGAYMQP